MDILERMNRAFGSWYEGLFGGSDDVRPKDILRRIITALEEHRKEGFDNRVYVPNQYILEIDVDDPEEKEYLLSFLDRDELETALRRYCQQNRYHIRGNLDFTIKEAEMGDGGKKREKVRVRCRYNAASPPARAQVAAASPPFIPPSQGGIKGGKSLPSDETPTVYEAAVRAEPDSEPGTIPAIASAFLDVETPNRPPFTYPVLRDTVCIGRSSRQDNDVVLEHDGLASKKHALLERDRDGRFTLYDLGSTNGVKVGGRRVENRTLQNGDEIVIGASRLTFRQSEVVGSSGDWVVGQEAHKAPPIPQRPNDPTTQRPAPKARLVLMDGGQDVDDFLLASETRVGRGLTNDIVLSDRTVATRHARVLADGDRFRLEALDDGGTTLNGAPVAPGQPVPLQTGDRLTFGALTLRFEE